MKNKILELKDFELGSVKGVRTPRRYIVTFDNTEILNVKFCWISKSENLFEIEEGFFSKIDMISPELKTLQNLIAEILDNEWLEHSSFINILIV